MSKSGDHHTVPLSVLLKRESVNEKIERPEISQGQASQSKKGEDFTFVKTECQRVLGDGVTTFSVFALFDGHNGSASALYSKENLLNNVLGAIPPDLNNDEWVSALPRALVAGFVKTDKDFQDRARERITSSGGEVGRLNAGGGTELLKAHDWSLKMLAWWAMPFTIYRRYGCRRVHRSCTFCEASKGLSSTGGRLIISSDGVWDALSAETAFECCRGMPPDASASQIVKEAVQVKGLRDDTTCIVVDIQLPAEKPDPQKPPPKKQGKGVFKSMFRKKHSESSSQADKEEYCEPDFVEELFEEGSAMLFERSEFGLVYDVLSLSSYISLAAELAIYNPAPGPA
ncbi:hypothetical protein OROMI_005278 [Orobanche minor]